MMITPLGYWPVRNPISTFGDSDDPGEAAVGRKRKVLLGAAGHAHLVIVRGDQGLDEGRHRLFVADDSQRRAGPADDIVRFVLQILHVQRHRLVFLIFADAVRRLIADLRFDIAQRELNQAGNRLIPADMRQNFDRQRTEFAVLVRSGTA